MQAKFITLDGIDGSGKSTHLATIKNWFEQHQLPVVFTREPGGTAIGEALREILLNPATQASVRTETLLMFAARQQHLEEVILPALQQGISVVSDRFTDATFAYQGGGQGVPFTDIEILENWVQGDLCPDLTLILDVPLEISMERINRSREKDRFEQEQANFFTRVREAYLQRAQIASQRYAIINSNRELMEVQAEIETILQQYLAS